MSNFELFYKKDHAHTEAVKEVLRENTAALRDGKTHLSSSTPVLNTDLTQEGFSRHREMGSGAGSMLRLSIFSLLAMGAGQSDYAQTEAAEGALFIAGMAAIPTMFSLPFYIDVTADSPRETPHPAVIKEFMSHFRTDIAKRAKIIKAQKAAKPVSRKLAEFFKARLTDFHITLPSENARRALKNLSKADRSVIEMIGNNKKMAATSSILMALPVTIVAGPAFGLTTALMHYGICNYRQTTDNDRNVYDLFKKSIAREKRAFERATALNPYATPPCQADMEWVGRTKPDEAQIEDPASCKAAIDRLSHMPKEIGKKIKREKANQTRQSLINLRDGIPTS